jgi:hypothetical protein
MGGCCATDQDRGGLPPLSSRQRPYHEGGPLGQNVDGHNSHFVNFIAYATIVCEKRCHHHTAEPCPRRRRRSSRRACGGKGDMNPVETQRSLAIAAASDKLWNGEITRVDFLRACTSARLGLAGLGLSRPQRAPAGTPTTHQITATAGPNSALEPSSDQQKLLRDVGRTFAGQTLHVVTEAPPPSLATRGGALAAKARTMRASGLSAG